jgi:Fur family ferric uptake transcriptional regulator
MPTKRTKTPATGPGGARSAPGTTAPVTRIAVPLCSVFRRYLKSVDLKYTNERADVLDAIVALDRPFEADELRDALGRRGRNVSKATVYRTLKLLVDAGILAELLLDRDRTTFQLVYGKPPTDVVVCVESGTRVEFTNPRVAALAAEICRELGWQPAGHRLQVYGVRPAARPQP